MRQSAKEYAPSVKATTDDIYPIMIEVGIENDHSLTDCMESKRIKMIKGFPNSNDANWMRSTHQPAQKTDSVKAHQQSVAGVPNKLQGKECPPKTYESDLQKYYWADPKTPSMNLLIVRPCSQ